ncbi:MAG: LIM-domain binding protein-domain-containing protein [Linnemannia elongata]|nr:MAG: LIM-domain binding protein-domain-containing protein [Linnemannia elongata]
MQLILDAPIGPASTLPLIVEYPSVTLVYHYTSGSKVFTKGSLKATFTHDLKFDLLEIVSQEFTEYIPRPVDDPSNSPVPEAKPEGKKKGGSKKGVASSKKAMPVIAESVINEFGISSKTLRLLEVSDMFSKMNELLHYTAQTKRGPAESLASYSQLLRDKHALMRAKQMSSSPSMSAASVVPMGASTPVQAGSQIATVNNGGPNPPQMRDSASPRAMKRRTSVGISPGDTAPRDSPALDDSQAAMAVGAGTPLSLQASTLVGVGPSTSGVVTGLGLNLVGSPVPSPLSAVTSPVFVSSITANNPAGTAPSSAKAAKRIRTASATPTLAAATPNGTKMSTTNGATTARNRKGAGRKDSSAKRKASMADISDTTATHGAGSAGAQELDAGLTSSLSAPAVGPSSVGHSMGVSGPNGLVLHGPASQQQQTTFQAAGNHSFNTGVLKGAVINGAPVFVDGGSIPASPMSSHAVTDSQPYGPAGNRSNGMMLTDQRNVFQPETDALSYGSGQDFTGLGNGGLNLGVMTGFAQDIPSFQAQAQAQAQAQMQGHLQVGQHAVQGLGQVQGPPIGYGVGYGGQVGQGMGMTVNGMMGSMEGMATIPPNATLLSGNSGLHPGAG